MTTTRCSNCGKEINEQANNCPYCDHIVNHDRPSNETSVKCSFCGVLNNSDSRFCESCGAPMEASNTNTPQRTNPATYQPSQRQPEPDPVLRDKFYKKSWFSALMLFIFFPVGLIFMWKYKTFSKTARNVISGFILLAAIYGLVFGEEADPSAPEPNTTVSTQETKTTEAKKTIWPEELTPEEAFIKKVNDKVKLNKSTSKKLYKILTDELGFKEFGTVAQAKKETANFIIDADDLRLSINATDKKGIGHVIYGNQTLYANGRVQMTKKELNSRIISVKAQSTYYTIAKEIVKNNLKSPRSAKFPWADEAGMSRKGKYVVVQCYVDADNSFGASIRSEYTVEFKVTDMKNYTYEVIYINIDGETSGTYKDLE